MNILLIVLQLYDGGAERVASIWASYLSNKDEYNVHLLSYWPANREYKIDDKVIRKSLYDTDEAKFKYRHFEIIRLLRSYIKDNNIDVIIPFTDYPGLHSSLARLFIAKSRVVYTIRINPWVYPQNIYKRIIRDFLVWKNKCLIVQTPDQMDYFKSVKNLNTCVVPNPINPKCSDLQKKYSGKLDRIVCVGRLELRQKNYGMVVEAIRILKERNVCISVDIYGDGPCRDKLQQIIDEEGLSSQITLKGNVENILEVEAQYDLFLMTSNYEGFPNALLEAMAIGMPVISTNCRTGPNLMIENGINGVLVDVGNSEELAETILKLKTNVAMMERMGICAKESVYDKYTLEQGMRVIEDYFQCISM